MAVPPAVSVTLVEPIWTVGAPVVGVILVESVIVPANEPRLVKVRTPETGPPGTTSSVWLKVMLKSATLTVRIIQWARTPLVAVMFTAYVPG